MLVCQTEEQAAAALAADARRGLVAVPKDLPPRWFYDKRGSDLFEEITRLPEYYPTRRETEILEERAGEIAEVCAAESLVELGSGASVKTRLLLDALHARSLRRYHPFDVCAPAIEEAAPAIEADYPGLDLSGVVGDFELHLPHVERSGPTLLAFLGGTIGNLPPERRSSFLTAVRSTLAPGDHFLLGADLVKDRRRLLAAYDDSQGVTAEFNRNVLQVLNTELDADFVPERFEHVAAWSEADEWIEMRLRSAADQTVRVGALDLEVSFDRGEEMRTEISAKFRPEKLRRELAAAELGVERFWTDAAGDFSLVLAGPA